ncbi:unnamed protein product [Lampetra planeri]
MRLLNESVWLDLQRGGPKLPGRSGGNFNAGGQVWPLHQGRRHQRGAVGCQLLRTQRGIQRSSSRQCRGHHKLRSCGRDHRATLRDHLHRRAPQLTRVCVRASDDEDDKELIPPMAAEDGAETLAVEQGTVGALGASPSVEELVRDVHGRLADLL